MTLLGCGRNDPKVCPDPVTSTAPIRTIELTFPKPSSGSNNEMILLVEIGASGRTMVDRRAIDDDEQLLAAAQKGVARNPNLRLVILADDAASYSRLIAIVDLVRTAGIRNLVFASRSRPDPVFMTTLPDAK